MLSYYVLEKTEECRKFFYSHEGFFNFWNRYLILNAGYDDIFNVLVNRPKTEFHGIKTEEQNECFKTIKKEHLGAHLPEEMFIDFPELEILSEYYQTI